MKKINKSTKAIAAFLTLSIIISLCACEGEKNSTAKSPDVIESANDVKTTETIELGKETAVDEKKQDITFADLAKSTYEFSSGVGAWSTSLTIEKDGYFYGLFNDSDMGDSGDDYPDGTVYCCDFTGHFSDLTKLDEYTYEMKIADIAYSNKVGTEEYADKCKYVYSDAYGLTGTSTFKVYLPGKPVSDINEEVLRWAHVAENVIEHICIENVDQAQAFYSSARKSPAEEAELDYLSYKESFNYFLDKLENAQTTLEMQEANDSRYKIADQLLNRLWTLIKYNTEESDYKKILEEQRAWLKERDEKAEPIRNLGGSLAPVDYADFLATVTMERCETLYGYIKK